MAVWLYPPYVTKEVQDRDVGMLEGTLAGKNAGQHSTRARKGTTRTTLPSLLDTLRKGLGDFAQGVLLG